MFLLNGVLRLPAGVPMVLMVSRWCPRGVLVVFEGYPGGTPTSLSPEGWSYRFYHDSEFARTGTMCVRAPNVSHMSVKGTANKVRGSDDEREKKRLR